MGYAGGMKEASIQDRASAVVRRHSLPDFITGFEVRVGEFDGDPALWIAFKMVPGPGRMSPEVERRVTAITALKNVLLPELLEEFEDRFPYFRFEADRGEAPSIT